jgi:hypothetical protein
VSDPGSDRAYYTTSVKQGKDGKTRLKDAATGSKVTLESSEILKISKSECTAAVKKK